MSVRSVVLFDIGGVLSVICHTWQEVADFTGIECKNIDPTQTTGLLEYPLFNPYQASEVTLEHYLDGLAEFLGCDPGQALHAHNGILKFQYEGVAEIVEELTAKGLKLGIISNTNQPHWEEFTLTDRFPAIKACPLKMASHHVGINKPDPAIFHKFCEMYSVEPTDVVFFDDGLVNVESALTVGFSAYQIDPNRSTAEQIRTALAKEGIL